MIQAPHTDAVVDDVTLDAMSTGLTGVAVSFALRYSIKSEVTKLTNAFSKVLVSFKALAGRLVKTKAGLVIRCNNAGVPISHDARAGASPPFDQPIPADVFDQAVGCVPAEVESPGEPLLRIRITDFDDAQVIAMSLNHGVCDAAGIGTFLGAWAEAFQGGSGLRDVSNDRSCYPPTPVYGSPPLSSSDGIPEGWTNLRHTPENTPEMAARGPLLEPTYVSASRPAQSIAKLKKQCKEMWSDVEDKGEVILSTNDVICAELISSFGFEGDVFPLSIIMEFRGLLGAPTVLGNMWMGLEFLVKNSLAAAGDIRKTLPNAASADFVRWNLGQGHNISFPGRLFLNSWVKALKLEEFSFAGPAEDVMLGLPMMEARAAMAQMGIGYCITLPQLDGGVKVVGILSKAAALKLAATESGASFITP